MRIAARASGLRMPLLLLGLGTGVFAAASISPGQKEKSTMELTSTAFKQGEAIPAQHTCDGKDMSPAIAWTGTPANAKSLALIMDDPDAPRGTWVHWVLYGLPASTQELKENLPKTEQLPGGARQGLNDFGRPGYGGPCPPPGKPHRYFFRIYALDTLLDLRPGTSRSELEQAMKSHILATGALMGTYKR